MFEFYGSTQESFGRDFFYVQYGVVGSSTAVYMRRGAAGLKGGHVRQGLIADAKKELNAAFPLGPNQSYVNMSIDISTTETGTAFGESKDINRVELTATVSADIIEFGTPPLNYILPGQQRGSLGQGPSQRLNGQVSNGQVSNGQVSNGQISKSGGVSKGGLLGLGVVALVIIFPLLL